MVASANQVDRDLMLTLVEEGNPPKEYSDEWLENSIDLKFIHKGGDTNKAAVNPWWIMMYSGSTVNLFCNPQMVYNIK